MAPAEGLQTPSGLETPSGMTSVVSTVAGGLETPEFLDLRKSSGVRQISEDTGPKSLYQVVPERQTAIRGLMGSERGYDVTGLAAANVPVLGQEQRGSKVSLYTVYWVNVTKIVSAQRWCGRVHRRLRTGRNV